MITGVIALLNRFSLKRSSSMERLLLRNGTPAKSLQGFMASLYLSPVENVCNNSKNKIRQPYSKEGVQAGLC
jgi:hypothetical protein